MKNVAGLCVLLVGGAAAANVVESSVSELPAGGSLVVESDSGAVEVSAAPGANVRVEARRRAPTVEAARALDVKVVREGDVVHVTYRAAKPPLRDVSVQFVITAPAATRLQLDTRGGAIRARGFSAGATAQTGGGAVTVEQLRGALKLRSGGGAVTAEDIEGPIEAETGGGAIEVRGRLHGENKLVTGGGAIHATVPRDNRLQIQASTGGGHISNDLGLSGKNGQLAGSVGDGREGSLLLRTGGGSISLGSLEPVSPK